MLRAGSAPKVLKLMNWLRCLLRGHHDPKRHVLGGFRCAGCLAVGESLDEMGFKNGGYVPPTRRIYERKHGSITRTDAYEPHDRRGW